MIPRELLRPVRRINHTTGVSGITDDDVGRGDDGADGRAAARILLVDEFVLSLQDLVQVEEGGVDGGLRKEERGKENVRVYVNVAFFGFVFTHPKI